MTAQISTQWFTLNGPGTTVIYQQGLTQTIGEFTEYVIDTQAALAPSNTTKLCMTWTCEGEQKTFCLDRGQKERIASFLLRWRVEANAQLDACPPDCPSD